MVFVAGVLCGSFATIVRRFLHAPLHYIVNGCFGVTKPTDHINLFNLWDKEIEGGFSFLTLH